MSSCESLMPLQQVQMNITAIFSFFKETGLMGVAFFSPLIRAGVTLALLVVDGFFSFGALFVPRHVAPPPTDDLLLQSATVCAARIRAKDISSSELLEAYWRQIQRVNGVINAVVQSKIEDARALAAAIDCEIAAASEEQLREIAETRPLLGVPFSVKDCIEAEGWRCTIGIFARRNVVAQKDAPAIARMKAAGAILLAMTNVPEVCLSFFTENAIYGRTANPYDSRRTSGGSSGGEGALIAAGGSVVGLGSDIGGSIRFPASFCGVYGLKSTPKVIDVTGHVPIVSEFRLDMLSIGPICRYAADLHLMMKVLSDSDKWIELEAREARRGDRIRAFWMGDVQSILMESISSEVLEALRRAVKAVESIYNVDPIELRFEEARNAPLTFLASLHSRTQERLTRILTNSNGEIDPVVELGRFFAGKKEYTLNTLLVALMEKYDPMSDEDRQFLLAQRDDLSLRIRQLLGDDGIIVCPSFPTQAPYHHRSLASPLNYGVSALWNVLGLPSVQVPIMFSSEGMPVGIQVVGGRMSDLHLIKVAEELHQFFGGWNPTPSV